MMEILTSRHPGISVNSASFGSPSTLYGPTTYSYSSRQAPYSPAIPTIPRTPPTPPTETALNMSLPPISSLLNFSRDENGQPNLPSQPPPMYTSNRRDQSIGSRNSIGSQDDASTYNSRNVHSSRHLQQPPTPPMHPQVPNSRSPPHLNRPQAPRLSTGGNHHYDPISNTHHYGLERDGGYVPDQPHQQMSHSYSPRTTSAPTSANVASPNAGMKVAESYPGPYHRSTPTQSHPGLLSQQPLPTDFPPPLHMNPHHPPYLAPNTTSPTHGHPARRDRTHNMAPHHHPPQAQVVERSLDQHSSAPGTHITQPQPQERYVCSTCGKAFSRPSSLRIHGHSHTGEKPFKCPHKNCGKAFSVRSNMKRHEKGCHAERERRLDLGPGGASRELLPAAAS